MAARRACVLLRRGLAAVRSSAAEAAPRAAASSLSSSSSVHLPGRRFVDRARVRAVAGHGGGGVQSFFRDTRVRFGPADGGDGGAGGDVIIRVAAAGEGGVNDLSLGGVRLFRAEHGGSGASARRKGRNGQPRYIDVPRGTAVFALDDTQQLPAEMIADLTAPDQSVTACRGGRGGHGNAHFKSSTNRSPYSQGGQPGESRQLLLELKSIADVGLVGYPNAGKSTLLRAMSNARPRVAAYAFTTLQPVIGVVGAPSTSDAPAADDDDSFTVADVPGIIDGAHAGRGLGLSFLRHIERTRVLVYVVDVSRRGAAGGGGGEVGDAYGELRTLWHELDRYMPGLRSTRRAIVVANKLDTGARAQQNLAALIDRLAAESADDDAEAALQVFPASAALGWGVDAVKTRLAELTRGGAATLTGAAASSPSSAPSRREPSAAVS